MDSGDYDYEILPPNIPPENKYQIFWKGRKETVNKCGETLSFIRLFTVSFLSFQNISCSILPQLGKRNEFSYFLNSLRS